MFAAAVEVLESKAESINSINVFPVPDGDTGSNLLITLKKTVAEAGAGKEKSVGFLAELMADRALKHATGNAGVILSQLFLGLSKAAHGKQILTPSDLSRWLHKARELAYTSIAEPVEGTMLTVLKDTALASDSMAGDGDITAAFTAIVQAAERSVAATPKLLPILRKNHVVDAGALGLYTIFFGMHTGLKKNNYAAKKNIKTDWEVDTPEKHETFPNNHPPYGYCTEFMIFGKNLDKNRIREKFSSSGTSLIAAGNEASIRIHIHTEDPGKVLQIAAGIGRLDDISIQNMDRQHESIENAAGKIGIIADSVSDLPLEIVEKLGITVVPLIVRFGTRTYRDGIDLTAEEFYEKLQKEEDFPETSVAPPAAFTEAYDKLSEECDAIVAVMLSANLSGTYSSAVTGIQQMKRKRPVKVVDTEKAAMGEGFLVIKAAEAAAAGASLQEVVQAVEENKDRVHFLATFDTLEYLRRGGRISKGRYFFGSLLGIHPMITFREGRVVPAGSALNRKKAIDHLFRFAAERRNVEKICISHAACPGDAEALRVRIQEKFPYTEIYSTRLTPVMGTHTGPGLLLVTVLGDK